ncbi:FKBP-type peptidyl-prolyl cis-trans isomerase [Methanorbis rubei]|uniref:Peptidyl-prolyl cis-trans isomerase n=1 Tax=Methanorbis rubei TaxID=3028300 RepID=A0AAE4MEQ7_9EURY|nr:Trigger factor [Methanocorpusculaceae archaeon Cs1]
MNKKILGVLFAAVALCLVVFAAGCIGTADQTAKVNDTVNVFYTLTLEDGMVAESNVGKTPLTFVVGSGRVVKGFDDAILGMKPGETKTVTLTPDLAYGEYSYNTYADVPISMAETYNNGPIEIGSTFLMYDYSTGAIQVVLGEVVIIDNESNMTRVVINAPYAGKTLIFEITLDSIGTKTT